MSPFCLSSASLLRHKEGEEDQEAAQGVAQEVVHEVLGEDQEDLEEEVGFGEVLTQQMGTRLQLITHKKKEKGLVLDLFFFVWEVLVI